MLERKTMKILTVIFWLCVAGLAITFGMTIFTAVQEHRNKGDASSVNIPTPAIPTPGNPAPPLPR
jgi:hypothetical protein